MQGDLTSDLRSDVAAETRAKMVYEYLIQFTDDPSVKDTLRFLMTREIAHFQMFQAALDSIQPNFPMGTLQGDPKYSNLYFNFSNGNDYRGPWNEGPSSELGETYQYIDDPIKHVMETNALLNQKIEGTERTEKSVDKKNKEMSKKRSTEVNSATPTTNIQWNNNPQANKPAAGKKSSAPDKKPGNKNLKK
jgi:Mn-containing catalase